MYIVDRPTPQRCALGCALLLVVLATLSCSARRPAPPADMSGFLDEYALLRAGGSDDVRLVYRNPDADWTRYHAVLLEPVTIWRSGRKSLDAVPEDDLFRLAYDFEKALRVRLGGGFRLVDQPGPGVMRIRLGMTEARATDPILDVFTVPPGGKPAVGGGNAVNAETRRFLDAAIIEGEIVDAENGEVLAQGVDGPRGANAPALDTWAAVDRGLARWVDRLCARLEARTGAGGAETR